MGAQKKWFEKDLYKLYDISLCKCLLPAVPCSHPSVRCRESDCKKVHIICECKGSSKVTIDDRIYLKDQRTKAGPKGHFQLGQKDYKAAKLAKRKSSTPEERAKLIVKCELPPPSELVTSSTSTLSCNCELPPSPKLESVHKQDSDYVLHTAPASIYNQMPTPCYALEAARYKVSLRAGAALYNALLKDLEDSGMLDKTQYKHLQDLYTDKCAMRRKIKSVSIKSKNDNESRKRGLACIGIDGKVDNKTFILRKVTIDGEEKVKQDVDKEHHLTFTCESGVEKGTYLAHCSIPTVGFSGKTMADKTLDVLRESESIDSLRAVICDNTNVNTGLTSFHTT